MDKAWIFVEICRGCEKGTPRALYDLQTLSASSDRHPAYYVPDFYRPPWGQRGPIKREVDYLIKWGLVKRTRSDRGNRMPLVPTELGLSAWHKIIKPLVEDYPLILGSNRMADELLFTTMAKVTELVPSNDIPPKIEIRLDPVLSPVFPLIRELMEEVRDQRPWLYALATGKLIDHTKLRLIQGLQGFRERWSWLM